MFVDVICGNCSGSGEGMYEGSRCYACRGRGEYRCEVEDEVEDPPEFEEELDAEE